MEVKNREQAYIVAENFLTNRSIDFLFIHSPELHGGWWFVPYRTKDYPACTVYIDADIGKIEYCQNTVGFIDRNNNRTEERLKKVQT